MGLECKLFIKINNTLIKRRKMITFVDLFDYNVIKLDWCLVLFWFYSCMHNVLKIVCCLHKYFCNYFTVIFRHVQQV